jgi:chromosome segregation ATPase
VTSIHIRAHFQLSRPRVRSHACFLTRSIYRHQMLPLISYEILYPSLKMSSVLPLLECESAQASTEHGVPDKSADVCSITKIKDPNSQNPKMSRSVIGDIYIENGGKITLQPHLQAYEFEALRRSFEEGVEVQEKAEDFEKRNEELRREIEEGAENQMATDDLRTRNDELRRKVEDGVEYQKRTKDLERRNEEFRIKTENESEYHKTTENLHERNEELRRQVEDGSEYQKEIEDLKKRNEELQRKIEEGAEYQKAAEDLHTRNEKLRRQVEDGSEYQKEVEDLKKRNEELQRKIEEGAKYQKAAEDLHTRNEELQRSNRELQSSVVDLEAKLAECDTKNQKAEAEICAYKSRVVDLEAKLVEFDTKNQKADAEICAYKTKTAYLEWDVQGLRKDIFSLLPFEQVTGTEILRRFDNICDSISSWIGKQLPRNSLEPRFLDGGNQHFAYFLKDNDRAGQFIIQSLIHQCLQKEFFGEHIYLVGLPEEHASLLQVIQTSMATRKPFPAQPRGTITSISG